MQPIMESRGEMREGSITGQECMAEQQEQAEEDARRVSGRMNAEEHSKREGREWRKRLERNWKQGEGRNDASHAEVLNKTNMRAGEGEDAATRGVAERGELLSTCGSPGKTSAGGRAGEGAPGSR